METPIRPKVYWANERTLLSWLRTSVLVATFGVALLGSEDSRVTFGAGPVRVGPGPGITLIAGALVMSVYATWRFYERLSNLRGKRDISERKRDPTTGVLVGKVALPYFDGVGPFVVGIFGAAAMSGILGIGLGQVSPLEAPCQANLVIVRHGESPDNIFSGNLSHTGVNRSLYLGRCAATASNAMYSGPPTALMAFAWRGPGSSYRGIQTLMPLASNLNLTIDSSVLKDDMPGFVAAVQRKAQCGGTLLVAWQHDNLPKIAKALGAPNHATAVPIWPSSCSSDSYPEPPPKRPGSTASHCFDQIMVLNMSRWAAGEQWIVGDIKLMHEGFGKRGTSPCSQDLAPV
jgi:uncharacterized membrane protein YidH (DUF202 family)